MGHFQHPESSKKPHSDPGFDPASAKIVDGYVDWVCSILKPKRQTFLPYSICDTAFQCRIEKLSDFHHPSIHHRPKGTLSQVWGRSASINLKRYYELKHEFEYDRIVVTRWDIMHNQLIDLDRLDPNYVSMDGMYGPSVISDAWASGPSDLINRWGEQYSSIKQLVENNTMNLGPHEWLKAWFDHREISWSNRPDVIDITITR